jgi:arginyl-tRNA synthetase
MNPIDALRAAVEEAAEAVAGGDGAPSASGRARSRPTLERPKQSGHGDYSTNAAMLLAPVAGAPPREIAQRLGQELERRLGKALARVEVAGPGFLNLVLADGWFIAALDHVLEAGERFGAGGVSSAQRINVEFVSANPTGPLHVGHARNAAYGDTLARMLAFHGHDVVREFYVNDFGSQVVNLGGSIAARARGEEVPPDGYQGDYVTELAAAIEGAAERPVEEVARDGVALMLDRTRASLAAFGVEMDVWFSERTLHEGDPAPVQHAFDVLDRQGRTYRHEGALWLRTTEFGDDKDRVLERSSGDHTYFASDIAYHQEKRERGFDRLLDVWGADHHGYVQRMKAAYAALGSDPDELELLIMQFVHLVNRGERSSMSKRRGEFVTLDELVDEVGVDAARWFLLARSHDTAVEFDLDLAREQTSENPVFYVQYAHARIASVLRKAGDDAVAGALAAAGAGRTEALHESERALVKKLLAWPEELADAAERRAPHRVAAYGLELAQAFTAFYRDCPIVDAGGEGVEAWRLALSVAAQRTIARALDLLGVSAPVSM